MRFRENSLAKAGESDDLDAPVRLTRPRGWVALLATVAVVVAGVVWAVTGTLPRTVDAPGVVVAARGNTAIQTPAQGQVTEIVAGPGDVLAAGEPVLTLQVGANAIEVTAAETVRVLSLLTGVGDVVPGGATVAVAERAGGDDDRLVATLFVPDAVAFRIAVGARVDLTVDSAPAQPFGLLIGRVTAVAPEVEDVRGIARFLADDGVVGDGVRVRRVVVDLEPADTVSGYAWSTGAGPPFPVGSGVRVVGAVHEPPIRPVDWLLP